MITDETIKNMLNYIGTLPLKRIALCCSLCAYMVWIGFVADSVWRDGDAVNKAMIIVTVIYALVGVAIGCAML